MNLSRSSAARSFDSRLIWLGYLVLFPAPWLLHHARPTDLAVSAVGVAVFLAVYIHSVSAGPSSVLFHIGAVALIGFALAPFGGLWTVFGVYAASMSGWLAPRRRALLVLAILQVALIAYGLLSGRPWLDWITGVFFGIATGVATLLQRELQVKNQQLQAAQGQVRAMAQSAERERIARDLHDLLGHTLTLVAVKADLAGRLVDRDADGARREMQEVAQAAREALGEVRIAITGMRGAALRVELEQARRMLAAANVTAETNAEVRPGDSAGESVLAMALREAVTNVIRHAGASRCRISLEAVSDGGVRLCVEDDGPGGDIHEGSGLTGMRSRLAAAGGTLDIQSGPTGARLCASLPALA